MNYSKVQRSKQKKKKEGISQGHWDGAGSEVGECGVTKKPHRK